jgi:DNA-directed RNA polymerase subunit RPC12/RpoP
MNSDLERYVQMACRCGADWVEDRLELDISCPSCGFKTNWKHVADVEDVLAPVELGEIDFTLSQLEQLMDRAGFEYTSEDAFSPPALSRHVRRRWTYLYSVPSTIWELTIDATAFRGEDKLRSVSLAYRLHGAPALLLTVIKAEDLGNLLAAIARAIDLGSRQRSPLGQGIFCTPARA